MDELITIDFNLLNRIFYNVLLNYYSGDGLYVNISSVTLEDLSETDDTVEDITNDISYTAKIRYGRDIPDKKVLSFDSEVTLTGYLSDNIEFTKGKFAQLIENEEFK